MPTVYFQLERSKRFKDNTHPIYLVVKFKEGGKEKRFRHYTGKAVSGKKNKSGKEEHWIGEGNKKRVSATAPGAGIINQRLETLRLGAEAIISNAQNRKENLTLEYFRDRFNKEVLGNDQQETEAAPPVQISFFEHLEGFIESKRNVFAPATIRTYETLKRSLQEFEQAIGYKLQFESINQIFITLYTKYLIEDTGVINNTLAKRVATLKAFLGEMKQHGHNTFTNFENFKASRNYDTTIMYLTEQELNQLEELQPATETLQHVLHGFLFSSYTGVRFSDWSRLTLNNIVMISHEGKQIKALKFTMFKVHKEVTIPLNNKAVAIVDRYRDYAAKHGNLFPVYTNQETNRSLKDLAKAAKINDVIIEVKKSGAKRITNTQPKHEVLTCHDARNTFATLYLERKGRPEVLQRLLGHTDIKQTMRYVKITERAVIADHVAMNKKRGKVVNLKTA